MKSPSVYVRICYALLLGGALWSCSSDTNSVGACSSDSDCELLGTRCDLTQSRCVCVTDDACSSGFFCNSVGICQEKRGCSINSECEDGTFCDIESGLCLTDPGEPSLDSPCGLSSHCPYGSVCQNGTCTEGCFNDGDCTLGQICLDGVCFTGPPGETICKTSDFCDYGDVCGSDNLCRPDRRGPYCRGCTQRTSMNPTPCDEPRNFCLINSQELGGFTSFCGVDCSLGQACPSGYTCNNVVVLTASLPSCGTTAECRCDRDQITFAATTCSVTEPCLPTLPDGRPDPDGTLCVVEGAPACNGGVDGDANCIVGRGATEGNCSCVNDSQCPNGGACVAGRCCTGSVRPEEDLRCVGGEGRVTGRCTCVTDDDCGRDSCDPTSGSCRITGVPCTPNAGDCPAIACVNGGCLIGQNCAPQQGLSCSVVTGP